jgi:ADP-ribose pyrophosphatase
MPPNPQQPVGVSSRRAYSGRVIAVDIETLRRPDGSTFDLEIIHHVGAAAVVPILSPLGGEDPLVLLIRQYRHAAGGFIWEIPAGVLAKGESPEDCARRELKEETGATAGRIERLTTILTTPGFTDERIHLYLATDLRRGEPEHEADEFIETRAVPLSESLAMVRDGEIQDGKTISALLYLAGFRLGR